MKELKEIFVFIGLLFVIDILIGIASIWVPVSKIILIQTAIITVFIKDKYLK